MQQSQENATAEGAAGKEPIVIIDDDRSIGKTLKLHFERSGYEVFTALNASEGLDTLTSLDSAIVILDVRLPDINGLDLLKEICRYGDHYYSIIVTAYPDMETTVKAVQNGVGEYIHKPIDIEEIDSAVKKADEFFFYREGEDASFIPIPSYGDIGSLFIGKSQAMKEVFKTVGLVSMSRATVHITGESGTGKELVAQAIHHNSADRGEPFISVNCSAIVDTLLESELFGHEKGSFTGAIAQKEGKFSLARDGAIFLDEIGEMDINLQAKLLRVLQEREFERVGGKEKLRCNCRIISATNQELEELVRIGKFREDLYYRLKVINIHIPPLRERLEDIPALTLYFIAKTNKETGRDIKFISEEAIRFLTAQRWKGNVRQLENVITHAVVMTRGDRLLEKHFASVIRPEDMTVPSRRAGDMTAAAPAAKPSYQPRPLSEVEKEEIQKALECTNWHKGKACDILGITRPRLERKLKKYGIKQVRYVMGSG